MPIELGILLALWEVGERRTYHGFHHGMVNLNPNCKNLWLCASRVRECGEGGGGGVVAPCLYDRALTSALQSDRKGSCKHVEVNNPKTHRCLQGHCRWGEVYQTSLNSPQMAIYACSTCLDLFIRRFVVHIDIRELDCHRSHIINDAPQKLTCHTEGPSQQHSKHCCSLVETVC